MAYKFLGRGGRVPFSEGAWPLPSGGHPGAWVAAGDPAADHRAGVQACTATQLPHWLDDELWAVELDGDVRAEAFKLVAPRARLVARIDAYGAGTARALAAACAWRARDQVAARLTDAGLGAGATSLMAPTVLADLSARAYELAATVGEPGHDLLVLIAEAAHEAEHVRPATAILTATVAVAGWEPDAQAVERAWQADWLVTALGLTLEP